MSLCIACLCGHVDAANITKMVFKQACSKVFKTVKSKLTNKSVGQVECVLDSSNHHKVRDLLLGLQNQVAKLMPHATRPSSCVLLSVNDLNLTGPDFAFSPRVSRREARTVFEALNAAKYIEAMWNEDDSKVLRKVSRIKGYSAIALPEHKSVVISCASHNKAVIPELRVFAWQDSVTDLSITLSSHARLGDMSIFPDLTELSLNYRMGTGGCDVLMSTQSTQDLLISLRLETIVTSGIEICLTALSQLPRLRILECMLTKQVQTNLGLMINLVKLTLCRTSHTSSSFLQLPKGLSSLFNLTSLTLKGEYIGGPVDVVCKLPNLNHLALYYVSCTGCLDDLVLLNKFEELCMSYRSNMQLTHKRFVDSGFREFLNMNSFRMTKQT